MDIKDIKPGMKAMIVKDPGAGFNGHGEVGRILTVESICGDYVGCKEFRKGPGEGGERTIHISFLGPVAFTKADLRTGMRVQYRCGWVRVVVGEKLYDDGEQVAALSPYKDSFAHLVDSGMDIVKVWAAPASCEDFFNLDVKGVLLFEREEKSEKDLKKEELSAKMDDIKKQLSALQEEYNSL